MYAQTSMYLHLIAFLINTVWYTSAWERMDFNCLVGVRYLEFWSHLNRCFGWPKVPRRSFNGLIWYLRWVRFKNSRGNKYSIWKMSPNDDISAVEMDPTLFTNFRSIDDVFFRKMWMINEENIDVFKYSSEIDQLGACFFQKWMIRKIYKRFVRNTWANGFHFECILEKEMLIPGHSS